MATGLRILVSVVVASGLVMGALLVLVWLYDFKPSDVEPSDELPLHRRVFSVRESQAPETSNHVTREAICRSREDSVREVINNSRTCTDTSQCTLVGLGCPFGCSSAVNVDHAYRAEAAASNYRSSTCGGCVHGCRPGVPTAQCLEGQCTSVYPSIELPEMPQYDPASRPTGADLNRRSW